MHPAPDYRFEQLVHQQRHESAARVRQARHLKRQQRLQKQHNPKTPAWDRFVQLLIETTPRPWSTTRTVRGEV